MSPELQTLSIGLTTLYLLWGLDRTTEIAYYLGLRKDKKNKK